MAMTLREYGINSIITITKIFNLIAKVIAGIRLLSLCLALEIYGIFIAFFPSLYCKRAIDYG